MYEKYFGLQEIPFSIAPNPRYLYMSHQHHEALAHLVYGIDVEGGFILLTGEVGTGKTTVCRCFLEQLPDQCEVAFILNSKLSITELLATICDELGICLEVTESSSSTKPYLDAINDYLLEAHAKEKKVLLIIDEAQNLAVEVLEQIRLLTNLETNRRKLLQIVLLGQPELRSLFELPELRQLAQRITARYHLDHLSLKDTQAYVQHRLEVAGSTEPLFPFKVIKQLYRYSGGIPRLINVLCDRVLLGAYASNVRYIDKSMIRKAAREVMGHKGSIGFPLWQQLRLKIRVKLVLASILLFAALGTWIWEIKYQLSDAAVSDSLASSPDSQEPSFVQESTTMTQPPLEEEKKTLLQDELAVETVVEKVLLNDSNEALTLQRLDQEMQALKGVVEQASVVDLSPDGQWQNSGLLQVTPQQNGQYSDAFAVLLQQWRYQFSDQSQLTENPCDHVTAVGLACISHQDSRLSVLKSYNRKAIVSLAYNDYPKIFLVLNAITDDKVVLLSKEYEHSIPYDTFLRFWTGDFTLLWRLPPDYYGTLVPGTIGKEVRWLSKMLGLALQDVTILPSNANYDDKLTEKVKQFQKNEGLKADGIAGVKTLMALSAAVDADVPVLIR